MRGSMKFSCPVPDAHCKGAKVQVEPLRRETGVHGSIQEIHKCIQNYLVNVKGYTQISRREYVNPENGYVFVICKKPGVALRSGKEGTRYIHRYWRDNRRAWIEAW